MLKRLINKWRFIHYIKSSLRNPSHIIIVQDHRGLMSKTRLQNRDEIKHIVYHLLHEAYGEEGMKEVAAELVIGKHQCNH